MYQSTQTAKEFVDALSEEMDVWEAFPLTRYLDWINAVEQPLYAHSVCFPARRVVHPTVRCGQVALADAVGNSSPREEDILRIYTDRRRELTPMEADLAPLFPYSYCVSGEGAEATVRYLPRGVRTLEIYYRCRPTPKTPENYETEHIALPDEYLELLREKVRGEAFFAAGEAGEAQNHLGAYQAYLDSFLIWAKDRKHEVGGDARGV